MTGKFKIKQIILEQLYFNSEVAKFLNSFDSQHDRDVVGATLNFIKNTYAEIAPILNGELILEETTED